MDFPGSPNTQEGFQERRISEPTREKATEAGGAGPFFGKRAGFLLRLMGMDGPCAPRNPSS